jgi:hypothetical protein
MSKLFEPISLGQLTLPNRIVIAPMCQYSSDNGKATSLASRSSRPVILLGGRFADSGSHRGGIRRAHFCRGFRAMG